MLLFLHDAASIGLISQPLDVINRYLEAFGRQLEFSIHYIRVGKTLPVVIERIRDLSDDLEPNALPEPNSNFIALHDEIELHRFESEPACFV